MEFSPTGTIDTPDLTAKLEPLQKFMEAGRSSQETSLLSSFEWNPISAGDRPLPEANDVTPWFRNRGGDAEGDSSRRPPSRRKTESMTEETFQDQYKRAFEGNVPQIFIPMRFRLPDLPFKKVQQRQVELDEGLSLYLPTSLLDNEFKTQLEDEIVRLLPHYADFERYFEVNDGRCAPALIEEEKWIIHKRYSRLCTRYKAQRQLLGHFLRRNWKATMANSVQPVSNTISELAAFRRSRPDWRSYVLFVRTFAHRYDFLPNLLCGSLKAAPPNATKNNLTSMANELIKARKDEGNDLREWSKPLLTQYKTLRMKKRIAKRKEELAEMDADDEVKLEEKPRTPKKQAEEPIKDSSLNRQYYCTRIPVDLLAPNYAPKTFRQRLNEGRKVLSERRAAAVKANKEAGKVSAKTQQEPNPEKTLQCSVDTQHHSRAEARMKRREARLVCHVDEHSSEGPNADVSADVQGIGQLFLSNVNPMVSFKREKVVTGQTIGRRVENGRRRKEKQKTSSPMLENDDKDGEKNDDETYELDEDNYWTEDEFGESDEDLTDYYDDGSDNEDISPSQQTRNAMTTFNTDGNVGSNKSPGGTNNTSEETNRVDGYERWKKSRESSDKTPPKREAIWRKRTKTRETKNFHRMLSQTSDRDPTYRTLRREGLRTPDGVPRSGPEDDDDDDETVEIFDSQREATFKAKTGSAITERSVLLSTNKNDAQLQGEQVNLPSSSPNRLEFSATENITAANKTKQPASEEGGVSKNEQLASYNIHETTKVKLPANKPELLSERRHFLQKDVNSFKRQQQQAAFEQAASTRGKSMESSQQRIFPNNLGNLQAESSVLSTAESSFMSIESKTRSSRPISPQLNTRSGYSANPDVHPVSDTSLPEQLYQASSPSQLCPHCHKPKTNRKSQKHSIINIQKNRGWRSFKQRIPAQEVIPSFKLPSTSAFLPRPTKDTDNKHPSFSDDFSKIQTPRIRKLVAKDTKNEEYFKPSVLDTVRKLDKVILKSGRYHQHNTERSHSPVAEEAPLVTVEEKPEAKALECYCCPSENADVPSYLDTAEDFLDRQRHMEDIHPRYYHSMNQPRDVMTSSNSRSQQEQPKKSIKVRNLLKHNRNRSTVQLAIEVPKLHKVVSALMKKEKFIAKSNANLSGHPKEENGNIGHENYFGENPEGVFDNDRKLHTERNSQKLPLFMQRWKKLRDFVHTRPS